VPLDDLSHQPREAALADRLRRQAILALLVGRRDQLHDLLGIDLAVADPDEELLDVRNLDVLVDPPDLGFVLEELAGADSGVAERPLEELLAEAAALVALVLAEVVANLGAGAGRADEIEPVLARLLVGARQHLDDVAVPQLVAERLDLAVDPRAGDV